jgi:tRNA pseudouridine38-40 synthase
MRIAAIVEYEGADYSGWQRQVGGRTIQGCVEQALSKVADHSIDVACAGRTDAGVHGLGQVIHFDTDAVRSERGWLFGTNSNLPRNIALTWVGEVNDSFHARFSAVRRRYRYVIFNRPVRPTFLAKRTTWEYRPLDEKRMHEAARHLLGEHDFSSYRTLACQAKSPVRTVHHLDVQRNKDLVIIDIEANAFLHHMVRNIAGVLITIGADERPTDWAQEVLELRNRTLGGVTASAAGLYFMEVGYSDEYGIPAPPNTSIVW